MSNWEFFIGITVNLYVSLGRIDMLTILSFPVHEHGLSLHLFFSLISFTFHSKSVSVLHIFIHIAQIHLTLNTSYF